ncbi:zinc transporter ZIP9-A-like [Homarus americanus]|uniref:zinc transporter ZIP9-A-like n=1 Tax=Homarus americanus TaxID=6706 RepID=UPI001C45C752|nr:zinc transporter ZIP9-A-like [Homarus americanus]
MDPVAGLLIMSIAMFMGCYGSGYIPLKMPMSEDRLEMMTTLGAGLLVGTALAVIIPEGVNTLFSMPHVHKVSPSEPHDEVAHEESSQMEPHVLIGPSLLFGFLFMLLIDRFSGGHRAPADAESNGSGRSSRPFTATLGLVVHAAADGIALGAAAASSQTDVEMIVFFAIMLHKAPAAFGLVTFLMHAGLDKNKIHRHLIIFALAAPIGTVLTYSGIMQSGTASLSSSRSTGIALLFSAGTFIYVSIVHVLPELSSHSHDVGGGGGIDHLSRTQLFFLIVGFLLPLVLSIEHHH